MTDPHETLARLLAGDLPAEQAAALRDQIIEDPALRAVWVDTLRLELDLLTLPLDAAHAPTVSTQSRPWARWGLAAMALLACGALLGQAVSPSPPGDPMDLKNTLLSAGAGSAITVAAMSGYTEVSVDGESQTIAAGESLTVTLGERPPTPSVAPRRQTSTAPDAPDGTGTDWEAEVRRLSIENAMLQGQLSQLGGIVAEWPQEVSDVFRAEAVTDFFEAAVADSDEMELLQIDCSEYPCIVMVEYAEGTEANTAVTQPLVDAFSAATDDELTPYVFLDGRGEQPVVGISLGAASVAPNGNRIDIRVGDLIDTLAPAEP